MSTNMIIPGYTGILTVKQQDKYGNGIATTPNGGVVILAGVEPEGLLTEDERLWAEDVYGYLDHDIAEKIIAMRNMQPHTKARDSKQFKKYKDAIESARELAKASGWPSLTGSTKQKYWALQIRQQLVSSLPGDLQPTALTFTKSAWWIEHRQDKRNILVALLKHEKERQEHHLAITAVYEAAYEAEKKAEFDAWTVKQAAKKQELLDAFPKFLHLVERHHLAAVPVEKSFAPKGVRVAEASAVNVGDYEYSEVRIIHGDNDSYTILLFGPEGKKAITVN